jgi:hypothetical protein
MTARKETAWQASLSIAGKQFGLHFIQRSGTGYLSASVGRRAAAEVSAVEHSARRWAIRTTHGRRGDISGLHFIPEWGARSTLL